MPKRLTFWKKVEACFVMTVVLWVGIEIIDDILHFIIHTAWRIALPLSIFAIWWYIHQDGSNQ